jgi:hypothetical protein
VAVADADGGIVATMVSPTGSVLDSFPLVDGLSGQVTPVAAGVDGAVLVAWETGAVRVDGAGTVTGVDLPGTIANGDTAVASNGTAFLLTRMTDSGLVSTRVGADGTVLDPLGIPVSGTGGAPSVAFNGSWLVVWNDPRLTGSGPGVYGARIRPNGQVVDAAGFLVSGGTEGDPAVSARTNGNGWMVSYGGYDASTASARIFARQVAPK